MSNETASDYIYPTCPNCNSTASEGDGLSMADVMKHKSTWRCPECGMVSTGQFMIGENPRMNWLVTREPTYRERLRWFVFGGP